MVELQSIISDKEVEAIVIGIPIGMQGQDTAQTKRVRHFAETMAG